MQSLFASATLLNHPILQRLRKVFDFDAIGSGKIGNGAGDAKDTMETARGEAEFVGGAREGPLTDCIECRMVQEVAAAQPGVESRRATMSRRLSRASRKDAIANRPRRLTDRPIAQLCDRDGLHFDDEIEAIAQRT